MSDFHDETQGRDEGRPPMEYDHTQWDGAERGECHRCGEEIEGAPEHIDGASIYCSQRCVDADAAERGQEERDEDTLLRREDRGESPVEAAAVTEAPEVAPRYRCPVCKSTDTIRCVVETTAWADLLQLPDGDVKPSWPDNVEMDEWTIPDDDQTAAYCTNYCDEEQHQLSHFRTAFQEAEEAPETPQQAVERRAKELDAQAIEIGDIPDRNARAAKWQTWLIDTAQLVREAREAGVSLPPRRI